MTHADALEIIRSLHVIGGFVVFYVVVRILSEIFKEML